MGCSTTDFGRQHEYVIGRAASKILITLTCSGTSSVEGEVGWRRAGHHQCNVLLPEMSSYMRSHNDGTLWTKFVPLASVIWPCV